MLLVHITLGMALFAQQSPSPSTAGTFGCGAPGQPVRTDFYEKPAAKFTAVAPPDGHERWMHRMFNGFDAQKYGLSTVEFFVNPVPTSGYNGNFGDDESKITAMRFYVRVISTPSNKDTWYLLTDEKDFRNQSLLYVQPDAGSEADQETPEANQKPASRDPLDEWMVLQLATPDPRLPLFSLADAYNDHGANAGGTIENNLLIDLRSGEPILRAAAQCIDWEGGGVCTAPDTAAVHYEHTHCMWLYKESDFLCTTTGPWGGSYNPVNATREVLLLQGKEPSRLTWAPNALPSLQVFVETFRNKPFGRALVRGVGYVDLIWKSDSILPGKQLLLLASPGAGDLDNARFTLSTVSGDGTVSLAEVPKWAIGGEKSDDDATPPGFTPSDDNISVVATEYAQLDGAHLLKAVSVRRTGGANIHVEYLVGVQAKDGNLVSNAVRLASEGSTYMQCGLEAADATALNFDWIASERAATIRVQQQEATPMDTDEAAKQCSWEGKLRWVDGVGFRVRKLRDLCALKPKDVVIDDHGAITTKPREREQ